AAGAVLTVLPTEVRGDPSQLTSSVPAAEQMHEGRERMVLSMVNEAAACLGERVAEDAETIDLAMVFGTGWAPHRGGPLHYADDRGLDNIVRALEDLAQRLGPRLGPGAGTSTRRRAARSFCTTSGNVETAGRR